MTFAATQKEQIVYYLGYPPTPEHLSRVQEKMDAITSLGTDYETRVNDLIAELQQLDTEIEATRSTADSTFSQLKGEARRFVTQLSRCLNLERFADIYGAV